MREIQSKKDNFYEILFLQGSNLGGRRSALRLFAANLTIDTYTTFDGRWLRLFGGK